MSKICRLLWLTLALCMALTILSGCGETEEADDEANEYVEAIPNMEMLGLSTEEMETTDQELRVREQPLVGDPAVIREHNQEVMAKLNNLLMATHKHIDRLTDNTTPTEVTVGNLTCKVWEGDGEKAHWRLGSCQKDKVAKRYAFVLRGRPLDSQEESAYLNVFAGEGVILPSFENRRRGHGWVGYNFNNIKQLTGENVEGTLGIGYHAVRRWRLMTLGLKDLKGPQETRAHSARYRFARIIGLGGHFSFVTYHDFLTRDTDDSMIPGQDGMEELGRVKVGWLSNGGGRTVWAACGGTVGDGNCVRIAQCWKAAGVVTFEGIDDGSPQIDWVPTDCPEMPPEIVVDQAPPETDAEAPSNTDGDTGMIQIETPPDPGE